LGLRVNSARAWTADGCGGPGGGGDGAARTQTPAQPQHAQSRSQAPTLAQVLDRAASYVAEFERQLTGIAADETYLQSMGIPGRHGGFVPTTERNLKATLLLVREGDEGYLEAREGAICRVAAASG
jgi:hypothetical protein